MKTIKYLITIAVFASASATAFAATVGVDVPVAFSIFPSCEWTSVAPTTLSTSDITTPATAAITLTAVCDAGTSYTVTTDVDSQSSTLSSGEAVTVSAYADPGYSLPLASGPGINGAAGNTGSQSGESVSVTMYVRATGQGAGGGFNSAGTLNPTSFRGTISY